MKLVRRLVVLAGCAAVVFLPRPGKPVAPEVVVIDAHGSEHRCAPEFAFVSMPDRDRVHALALFDDLSYGAVDAGPWGCAALVLILAIAVAALSSFTCGKRAAVRRFVVFFSLGTPLVILLTYNASLLPGRTIRLGPEASGFVPASLHTQSNFSTGLLSPEQLVAWHYERGFRILNVSDRDRIDGALRARDYAASEGLMREDLLVLIGEEYHGRPDYVLVNVKRAWLPGEVEPDAMMAGVHREGGAVILAHPWDKLEEPIDDALARDVDAVEVVNGVIAGGSSVTEPARRRKKALIGSLDYKYGPHVTALTLIPFRHAGSPEKVVEALKNQQPRVLHAIPGGSMTGATWNSQNFPLSGAIAGIQSVYAASTGRRVVWFLTLSIMAGLWWVATHTLKRPTSVGWWRLIFVAACLLQFASLLAISWEFREAIAVVSIPALAIFNTLVAVPLLAASHNLMSVEKA